MCSLKPGNDMIFIPKRNAPDPSYAADQSDQSDTGPVGCASDLFGTIAQNTRYTMMPGNAALKMLTRAYMMRTKVGSQPKNSAKPPHTPPSILFVVDL